jgi:hypothetical protein
MGLRGVGTLWPRARSEYVEHDSEPPPEWREAPRASVAPVERPATEGIEVIEQAVGHACVIETHFRIRCDCGKRWWALDLGPSTCPRCGRWVSVRSAE